MRKYARTTQTKFTKLLKTYKTKTITSFDVQDGIFDSQKLISQNFALYPYYFIVILTLPCYVSLLSSYTFPRASLFVFF